MERTLKANFGVAHVFLVLIGRTREALLRYGREKVSGITKTLLSYVGQVARLRISDEDIAAGNGDGVRINYWKRLSL